MHDFLWFVHKQIIVFSITYMRIKFLTDKTLLVSQKCVLGFFSTSNPVSSQ